MWVTDATFTNHSVPHPPPPAQVTCRYMVTARCLVATRPVHTSVLCSQGGGTGGTVCNAASAKMWLRDVSLVNSSAANGGILLNEEGCQLSVYNGTSRRARTTPPSLPLPSRPYPSLRPVATLHDRGGGYRHFPPRERERQERRRNPESRRDGPDAVRV